MAAASADSGPGRCGSRQADRLGLLRSNAFDQGSDEIRFRGEITVDGTRRDPGSRRHGHDLDGVQTVFARDLPRRCDNGIAPGIQPLDHAFGAAISHGNQNRNQNRELTGSTTIKR